MKTKIFLLPVLICILYNWVNANNLNDSLKQTSTYEQSIVWKEKTPLPVEIRNGSAVSCCGKIYFMGGFCVSSPERFGNKNFEYDPKTNTWSEKAKMPTGRANFTLVSADNKIYAIGGDPFSGKNEMYDPQTDSWTDLAPIPTPRQHVYGTIVNNKIYIIGGLQKNSDASAPSDWDYKNISSKNEVYDIAVGKWEEKAPLPAPRHDTHSVTVNSKVYVLGGMGDTSSIWKSLQIVEMYDPQNDKWEEKKIIPEPRDGFGLSAIDNKIFLVGGFNNENVVSSVLVYNTDTDLWSTASDFPNERNGSAGSTTLGDTIYIIGGCDKNYKACNLTISGKVYICPKLIE